MSQNDFVVANADGATVRADINSALQALASLSSGTAAPGTTYAGQFWWDTTNNLIKIRNGANNAWVTAFSWDGTTLSLTAAAAGVLKAKGTTIASAATTDIGAADSDYIDISGTTGITSLGTTTTRNHLWIEFQGAVTVTHNGTSLILPGAANYTTVAGDVLECIRVSAGNWKVIIHKKDGTSVVPDTNGKHAIWIPWGAFISRTTNGPSSGTVELGTNKQMLKTGDFDATTQEFAQVWIRMPKSWNESTVTASFTWSHAATASNFGVVWALEAVAFSDDDAQDASFGTAQQIADTGGTTNDCYQTSETPAITIAGSPAAQDYVCFQVKRVPADGSDTMAIDARLQGMTLFITTDAGTDA